MSSRYHYTNLSSDEEDQSVDPDVICIRSENCEEIIGTEIEYCKSDKGFGLNLEKISKFKCEKFNVRKSKSYDRLPPCRLGERNQHANLTIKEVQKRSYSQESECKELGGCIKPNSLIARLNSIAQFKINSRKRRNIEFQRAATTIEKQSSQTRGVSGLRAPRGLSK